MYSSCKKSICLLSALCSLLFYSVPVFSQTEVREQGLVTDEPVWRQALGGEVMSLPHVQAQSAVVSLDGGNIKAYSTAGTPLWNYSARGRISPYVTRSAEGTSYITRTTGILIAVNRAGRELWRRNLESPLIAKPVIGWDGRLFVPVDKKIFCYTASGTLLWTKTFESSFTIMPKLDLGGNLLLAFGTNIYRIDPFGNAQVWVHSAAPAFLFFNEQQRIMAILPDGTIDIIGASQDWFIAAQSDTHADLLPSLPARPLAAAGSENYIAAILNDGRVSLLSIKERRIIWTVNSHIRESINSGGRAETEAEIFFDEKGIYVLSRSGATGFDYDGKRLWFTFLRNTAAIPAFGEDGILYSGGRDWILYAYKMEDRDLPQRNSLYGRLPEGNYGMGRPHAMYIPNIPLFDNEIRNTLDQIGIAINTGKVGPNEPGWTTFLLNLSVSNGNIIYRIAAINLLGKLGSRDTIPWLINIFNRENDPSIRTAAVNAIGDIGVDPQGAALQTFINYIIQNRAGNDQILTAIAFATGALCRFSGPPISETGIRILNLLTATAYPQIVRRQAEREIASLR